MTRHFWSGVFFACMMAGLFAAPKPAEAVAPTPAETQAVDDQSTLVRWYGHGFMYITNSTGIRIAINPFGTDTVSYPFPARLPADVVLISDETEDHSAADGLFGASLVFRAGTAVGLNRGSGLLFKGVQTYKDTQMGKINGSNTAFTFTLDGVNFAHLGSIAHPLSSRQRENIGRVDVLFLPVGETSLPPAEFHRMVKDLEARIIVPINYKTPWSGALDLRPLSDFLEGEKNVKRLEGAQFPVNRTNLPAQPTIYIPKLPS